MNWTTDTFAKSRKMEKMDMRARNGELNHNPNQNTQSVGRNFLSMWSAVDQYKSQQNGQISPKAIYIYVHKT